MRSQRHIDCDVELLERKNFDMICLSWLILTSNKSIESYKKQFKRNVQTSNSEQLFFDTQQA